MLSFTQGFLLGQLSIVVLIGAFIKYFVFGELPSADSTAAARAAVRRQRTLAHKRSHSFSSLSADQQRSLRKKRSGILRNPPPLTTGTILTKTYYNVDSHQPESVDWFNVLIAQTIAQFRNDAQHDDAILASLNTVLNGDQKPDFVDGISVTEVSLGEDFPIFSNCRVRPVDEDGRTFTGASQAIAEGGRLQARMDVDLSDVLTLGVETKLILNYPKPMCAVLPVALTVSVVRFSGTVCSPLGGMRFSTDDSTALHLLHPLLSAGSVAHDARLFIPRRLPPRPLHPLSTRLPQQATGRAQDHAAGRITPAHLV